MVLILTWPLVNLYTTTVHSKYRLITSKKICNSVAVEILMVSKLCPDIVMVIIVVVVFLYFCKSSDIAIILCWLKSFKWRQNVIKHLHTYIHTPAVFSVIILLDGVCSYPLLVLLLSTDQACSMVKLVLCYKNLTMKNSIDHPLPLSSLYLSLLLLLLLVF